MSEQPKIVLDTNVFVAAGFNRESHSARILRGVEEGRFALVWDEATRRETEMILARIPRLGFERVAPLFRPEGEHRGPSAPERFDHVEDPDDRKFASLAARAGAVLVTNDNHLLAHRGRRDPRIETPAEFLRRAGG
jgi:predicted nucleic acid-binding protein